MDETRTLDSIIASMRDGVVVVDASREIWRCNEAAGLLLNIDASEILGKPIQVFEKAIAAHVVDRTALVSDWRQAVSRINEKPRLEFEFQAGETRRRIEATLFAIQPAAERYGTGVLLRDVTAQHDIAQIKDEFASMVAHELRNPMTIIIGALATVLGNEQLSAEDKLQLVKDAADGAQQADALLGNLLDLTRAQTNRLSLRSEPVEIVDLIRTAVRSAQKLYSEHRFVVRSGRPALVMRCDPVRVERVMSNLLDNAAKYSPQGSHIEVIVTLLEKELVVGVKDHGSGISPENMNRLFQSFERFQESVGGTGIGLIVCRRLVEAHGGRIWAESKPGAGSTFSFALPMGD